MRIGLPLVAAAAPLAAGFVLAAEDGLAAALPAGFAEALAAAALLAGAADGAAVLPHPASRSAPTERPRSRENFTPP